MHAETFLNDEEVPPLPLLPGTGPALAPPALWGAAVGESMAPGEESIASRGSEPSSAVAFLRRLGAPWAPTEEGDADSESMVGGNGMYGGGGEEKKTLLLLVPSAGDEGAFKCRAPRHASRCWWSGGGSWGWG